jgi:hypothetical protein
MAITDDAPSPDAVSDFEQDELLHCSLCFLSKTHLMLSRRSFHGIRSDTGAHSTWSLSELLVFPSMMVPELGGVIVSTTGRNDDICTKDPMSHLGSCRKWSVGIREMIAKSRTI